MPSSTTRSRSVPLHPRRVSGPVRRPLPAGASVRGRTSAFEKIARLPDYKLVDRLLRSRASIWLIGILLGGIVAMQVSLLRLNTGISHAITTQKTLEDQNAALQTQIAERTSAATIRVKAADLGMVDPEAGNNRYLNSRGVDKDAKRARGRYTPPSDDAVKVMANNGVLPPVGLDVAAGTELVTVQNTVTTTEQTPTATTAQATPTPAATPEPLPTPVPTVPPAPTVQATDPAAGAATAPQG